MPVVPWEEGPFTSDVDVNYQGFDPYPYRTKKHGD